MIVRLSLLDKKPAVYYPEVVDVYKFDDRYEYIGTCKVFKDASGKHFGQLELNEDVNSDFYFYYRARFNEADIFHFAGLDFLKHEDAKSKTTKLKDMIVD